MNSMRIRKINKKILLIISVVVLILLAGIAGYLVYAHKNSSWPFDNKNPSSSQPDSKTNSINYNPPTKQEVESSQDGKKNSAPSSNNSNSLKTLSVVVSYAGSSDDKSGIEVDAYTPDVIEGSGICTATFTNGSSTITTQSQAMVDATTSICQPIITPLSKFNKSGTWTLTVKYASPTHSGSSSPQNVEVKL